MSARIATSPLTGRIHYGRVNKSGTAFVGSKQDVTSDVLRAVIEKAAYHGGSFEIEAGDRKWTLKVTEAGAAQAAPVVPQPAAQQGEAVALLAPNFVTGPGEQKYLVIADDTAPPIIELMGAFPVYRAPPARQAVALTPSEVDGLINASREADEGPTDLVRRVELAVWQVNCITPAGGEGRAW